MREKGNALLEFALIAPVLVLMALGAADFARVVSLKIAVQNAANAAANFLSQAAAQNSPCPPTIDTNGAQTAAAKDFGGEGAGFSVTATVECGGTTGGDVTATWSCACSNTAATYVRVHASAPFATLGMYPGIPSSVVVNAQAVARVQ